jgi:REP element-mobilizing transposase RayT
MAHTAGNVVIHLIFSTKGRQALITTNMRDDLFGYLGGIIREMKATALIVNGTADHVHVLMRIRPAQSVAEVARVVKANSSRWVREKGNTDFAWQTGYGAFSVSESNVATRVEIYRNPGRASSQAIVSGRVRGIPQEKQNCI